MKVCQYPAKEEALEPVKDPGQVNLKKVELLAGHS